VYKTHPHILYIGEVEKGRALLAEAYRRGWHVYLPMQPLEALAMYIHYYPDVVVLDYIPTVTFAMEVAFHLKSIDAPLLLECHVPTMREEIIEAIEDVIGVR
jgi:hypothetical protein